MTAPKWKSAYDDNSDSAVCSFPDCTVKNKLIRPSLDKIKHAISTNNDDVLLCTVIIIHYINSMLHYHQDYHVQHVVPCLNEATVSTDTFPILEQSQSYSWYNTMP